MEKLISVNLIAQLLSYFMFALGIIFVILKLLKIITWSWLLVTCPFLIMMSILALFMFVMIIILLVNIFRGFK